MEPLGILYYIGSFPSLSQSFILNEIKEVEKRGHNVAVFAQNNPDEDISHEEYEKINAPTYYANLTYADIPQLLSSTCSHMGIKNAKFLSNASLSPKQIGNVLLLGKECAEFIKDLEYDIDVIIAHFASHTRIGAILAARFLDIKIVVTAHAVEIFKNPNIRTVKTVCDGSDRVIVPSKYNKQYLQKEFGVENGISIVPATTKVEKFESKGEPDPNRILTVGRLVEKKGYEYAIDAINRLINQGHDISYHIVGEGHRKDLLKRKIQRYEIENHVEFLGNVSDERLRGEFKEASIFLLPCVITENGDRDAMPVVLKEAMASETACVSTSVSAIPELITHMDDGLIVPPNDSKALAEAVEKLLTNPELRKSIEENGKQSVVERFDITHSVDLLVDKVIAGIVDD